jgi:hypothetical protein
MTTTSVVALRILLEIRDHLDGDADNAVVIVIKPQHIPPEYKAALLRWVQEPDR